MQVPSGFIAKAKASAEELPRETVAQLLNRLMPRAPVAKRRVTPEPPSAPEVRLRPAGQPMVPAPFAGSGKRRRKVTPKYPRTAAIALTEKGRRKLRRTQDTSSWRNLEKLGHCQLVKDAYVLGLKPSDIHYQAKVGTITVQYEGEVI